MGHYPWSLSPFAKPEDHINGEGRIDETVKNEGIDRKFTNKLKVKIADEVPLIDLVGPMAHRS